jgi:hypothetical protein
MMLTIERYNDHHFESLIEHALHLCLVANSVMPVSELREHHEHVRANGTVNCDDFTCHKGYHIPECVR